MSEEITNIVLLKHMQGMKNDLQQQIADLDVKIGGLDTKIGSLDTKVSRLEKRVAEGFEDARLHRQALQEDLEATMRMLSKHDAKLARL